MNTKLATFTFILISIVLLGSLLVAAKSLLIPIIIAVFIWHLLNTMVVNLKRLPIIGPYLPTKLALIASFFILFYLGYFLAGIITTNVNDVINAAPRYQSRFIDLLSGIDSHFHIKLLATINEWAASFNLRDILLGVYGIFTTITSNALLIVLYVIFLFIEQQVMRPKLKALFNKPSHIKLADTILGQIVKDTQTYVGIKTLLSFFTSLTSWLVMKSVGLDFAEFWAILIFFLNFIPNIGSILATLLPSVLALIQFQDSWWPFTWLTSGIVLIQFFSGNIIEPRLMGNRLNLSPLVILITLAIWGHLWGIIGMFLSVPVTVIMMIIFSHFEQTQTLAILLSLNGEVTKADGTKPMTKSS
jgi:AI-2 transport protein TqsA